MVAVPVGTTRAAVGLEASFCCTCDNLMQSVIMTTIFWSGRGLGLFGAYDYDILWMLVVAVWGLELVWSPLWLSRFGIGPMEWVWRRLTYGKGLAASGDQPQPSATAPQ